MLHCRSAVVDWDANMSASVQQCLDNVSADKASAAGYENFSVLVKHVRQRSLVWPAYQAKWPTQAPMGGGISSAPLLEYHIADYQLPQ